VNQIITKSVIISNKGMLINKETCKHDFIFKLINLILYKIRLRKKILLCCWFDYEFITDSWRM
jgi:hypothetical protein